MIKAVVFDLDGTLYDYDTAHAKGYHSLQMYAINNLNLSVSELDKLYDSTMAQIEKELGCGCVAIHDRSLRFQRMLENSGKSLRHALPMTKAYWDVFLDSIQANPGIYEAISWLKSSGYTIGIGTNMTIEYQLRKLDKLNMSGDFDFIVSSEETQIEKPAKELFECCSRKAGCLPEECLFIGDNYKMDVIGSRNAGFRSLLFSKKPAEEQHISDFRELKQILPDRIQVDNR